MIIRKMKLKNKVAIITGASSGIGKATAIKLGKEGVKVALLARSKKELDKVKKEIEKMRGEAISVHADVTKEKEIKRGIKKTLKKYKKIDILVNNAGLGIFKNVEDMDFREWRKQIDVMLNGSFLMTHHSLPHIYKQDCGHVVNITSLWAKRFAASCAGYTAAKFGVRGFTQSLREEARKHNTKVTNVMPGTVNTPFFDRANWETNLSKAMEAEDIADTVRFILTLPDRAVVEEVTLQAINPPKGN